LEILIQLEKLKILFETDGKTVFDCASMGKIITDILLKKKSKQRFVYKALKITTYRRNPKIRVFYTDA